MASKVQKEFWEYAQIGSVEKLQELLDAGADVNANGASGAAAASKERRKTRRHRVRR